MTPLVRAATAMADDLVGLARAWRPDLVVADPLVLAAPLAAGACGATLVHHLWGPAMTRRMSLLGSGSGMTWPVELRELYDRYDVAPRAEPAVASVDGCPASLQYRDIPQRVPMRYVPYNGSGRLPGWLVEPVGRPRICVTWGTLSYDTLGSEGFAVPRVLEALAGIDAEVVVTVGETERAMLGDPPPGMRFVSNMPLSDLLPGCAAVVHQGGAGTMLTAAAAGVPQVAVTVLPGHVLNGRRLADTGAGVVLDMTQADRARLTGAVATALSDRTRTAAERLRAENLAQPTPAEVVGTLADLVGAHRERGG